MASPQHLLLDETEQQRFAYEPHALAEDEMRILEIQPGHANTTLACNLLAFQRSSVGLYKALSYVWGTSAAASAITINNKDFMVTENLKDALHRIRSPNHIIRLWVDAICINQDSNLDRDAQVQRMGQTYARADEVLIWLGNGQPNSSTLSQISELSGLISQLTHTQIKAYSPAIAQFFSNPWFVRVWVLQEAALAEKATIILGAEECDISVLTELSNHMDNLALSLDAQDEQLREASKGIVLMHQPIRLGRRLFNEAYGPEFLRDTVNGPSPFESMVLACRRRVCRDPRDHVFGLVGMAQQLGMESQHVDYSLSTIAVFKAFAETALTRRPNSLAWFESGLSNHKSIELPSWAPDLSQAHETELFQAQFYFAGGTNVHEDVFTESLTFANGTMSFSGYEFDVVVAHHYCEFSQELLLALMQDFDADPLQKRFGLAAERLLDSRRCDIDPYKNQEGRLEACWRTFVGNVRKRSASSRSGILLEDLTDSDERKHYNLMMDRESPDLDDEEEAEAFSSYLISLVVANRTLFVTERGYLGIGSNRVATGDLVVVAPGLGMPLILRKQTSKDRHLMVGVSYVHGIMKGEFMGSLSETSRAAPQTYAVD